MNNIEFIDYPKLNFSKLFTDFINNENYISTQFKNTSLLMNDEYLNKIASNPNRTILKKVIENSFYDIELSENQKNNIKNLENSDSIAIVTGQQIGFLGGPLYTFLKIQSAISLAKELTEKQEKYKFIPIFWIEDNDHDKEEAATAFIYDFNFNIKKYQCEFEINKSISASQIFDESISNVIENINIDLQNFRYKDDITNLLNKCYTNGKSWTYAFVEFLNHFFADDGLLFVSANTANETGIFQNLIDLEIKNYDETYNIIKSTSQLLINHNYHQQVSPSKLNLFYHQNNIRTNFLNEIDSHLTISDYSYYSPKALLRPIFQDFLIPNAAYIAGQGEVAYNAQITELYKYFNVEMPVIIARHSATIVNKKVTKFLENLGIEPLYFNRNFNLIEQELAKSMTNDKFSEFIIESKNNLSEIFQNITLEIAKFDKQLVQSCLTAEAKAKEQIEFLEKKAITAIKRNNSDTIKKYFMAKNTIFPNDNLQERVFPVANFIAENSLSKFKSTLEHICGLGRSNHIIFYAHENY